MAQPDDILNDWRRRVIEYLARAETEKDPGLRLAYLDIAEGYRRLVQNEETFRAMAQAMSAKK